MMSNLRNSLQALNCVRQYNFRINLLKYGRQLSHVAISNSGQRFAHSNNNGDSPPENVKRMKLYKLLFSTILFGSTLGLALYIKRKRSSDLRNLLAEARRLPVDCNYENSGAQHMYIYNGFVLNLVHLKALQAMSDRFRAKRDDIYVISFPKAGTTWVQEIVYLIGNDLNYDKAASQIMETRFPYLEHEYPGWQSVNRMPSERYIKSHLPYSLLPNDIKEKNCKIIYVTRNPKDVLVSYYFYVRMLSFASYKGTLKEFFDSFLKNEVYYGPFWKHVLEFWSEQDKDNVLFVKYEDMHKDIEREIKRIATFLGKYLSEDEVQKLAKHVSFDEMATNSTTNYSHWDDFGMRNKGETKFLRKGKMGDWKNYFTVEMNTKMDSWIKENTMQSDLVYDYE